MKPVRCPACGALGERGTASSPKQKMYCRLCGSVLQWATAYDLLNQRSGGRA